MVHVHHLLVVDDDVTFAGNTARLMQARGYAVTTAHEGHAALNRMAQSDAPVEVVLLDIRMPGMNGLEILRRIKSNWDVPVIILTGHADVEYGVEAIREGAFDFLTKPCPFEDLAETVRSACELKHIRQRPLLWPRSTAGELLLYSFLKLYPEDPLARAVEIFNSDQIKMAAETLFVVDRQDRLKGLVTRKALLAAAQAQRPDLEMTWLQLARHPEWLPSITIGRLMVPEVMWTPPEQTLKELAQIMLSKQIRSIPVVDQARMVGIVRLRDLLRYLPPENGAEVQS
jgi:two-component system, NtrC family, response regulator HydG